MSTGTIVNYTQAIESLPPEAFLGSLLWFSISQADINLDQAKADLSALGLELDKDIRPVDAFRKASREFEKKFKHPGDSMKSEFLVRTVGEDSEQAHRFVILERAQFQAGKKRRVFYEKVAELRFNRGTKKNGSYEGHSVEMRRTTANVGELTPEEDAWLTQHLDQFQDRYQHFLTNMDSHAVRTYVRELVYSLSGTCVKESGGLYFVRQDHAEQIEGLGQWVRSIGSEFHTLPLLNLAEQRQMIMEAFEDETVREVDRLMGEVAAILQDPSRGIEEKTFDAYGLKAAELREKVDEYNAMLGYRADKAAIQIGVFGQQVMALAGRIRQTKSFKAKVV